MLQTWMGMAEMESLLRFPPLRPILLSLLPDFFLFSLLAVFLLLPFSCLAYASTLEAFFSYKVDESMPWTPHLVGLAHTILYDTITFGSSRAMVTYSRLS